MKKTNGVNQLTPEQEKMRMDVVDLEFKARYWEAQWKIKYYSLETEKLEEPYKEFMNRQAEMTRKYYEELMKHMEKEGMKMEPMEHPGDPSEQAPDLEPLNVTNEEVNG